MQANIFMAIIIFLSLFKDNNTQYYYDIEQQNVFLFYIVIKHNLRQKLIMPLLIFFQVLQITMYLFTILLFSIF